MTDHSIPEPAPEYAEEIDLDIDPVETGVEMGDGVVTLRPARSDLNDRLDKFIAGHLPDLSRSYIQRLIEDGHVLVDGHARRQTFKVTPGEAITVQLPEAEQVEVLAENIPLVVVYEDADLIVIDKPAGMVVHPAPGHPTGTLVNALLHHCPEIAIAGSTRPGIVHRIDKDTSGLLVAAKTDRGQNALVRQWGSREIDKGYVALVHGNPPDDEATIDAPIGRDPRERQRMAVISSGREAVTHFTVRERFDDASLLDLTIDTGRTHQIRVHLAFIGHPIAGDSVYNRKSGPFGGAGAICRRQFLHAARLGFDLPNGERVTFTSPLPPDLQRALDRVRLGQVG